MTALFGMLMVATACLSMYLVQFSFALAAFIGVEALALLGLLLVPSINYSTVPTFVSTRIHRRRAAVPVLALVCCICLLNCAYLLSGAYALLLASQFVALVGGTALVVHQLVTVVLRRKTLSYPSLLVAAHVCLFALVAISVVLAAPLVPTALDPDGYLLERRSATIENRVDSADAHVERFADGNTLVCDIAYADDYPNSTFDLYLPKEAGKDGETCPVFVYVHGGGYFTGDKNLSDVNAMGPGCALLFEELLDAGYAVVSMNYALAPEFAYPVPIIQMSQLVEYLQNHAGEYQLDLQRVVLGGGSAGGQIAGQFAALQCDGAYAEQVGVAPVLEREQIEAVYLGCALIDPELFSAVDDPATSYLFFQMQRAYFGDPGNGNARQADLLDHVTSAYPPTYVTDGTDATFDMQAHELVRRFERLDVSHETFLFDRNGSVQLSHGYDIQRDVGPARENVERFLAFLEQHA